MKAVVYDSKEKLVCTRQPMPGLEKNDVLVRVAHVGFCGSDHSLIESGGLKDGDILGHEVSGTVVETGRDAGHVSLGEKVIIRPTFCGECSECRMGKPHLCRVNRRAIGMGQWPGAFAEYVAVSPAMLIPIPDGVDSINAALTEAFASSYHGISVSGVLKGSALVIGGGAIGLGMVGLLTLMGFGPVALSEPVEAKRHLAHAMGAHLTIDPRKDHLAFWTLDQTGGRGFDVVFECSGVPECVTQAINAAAIGGTVCIVSMIFQNTSLATMTLNFKEVRLTAAYSNTHGENRRILEWMAEKRLDGHALISDSITLDQLPDTYHQRIHPGKSIKVMMSGGPGF